MCLSEDGWVFAVEAEEAEQLRTQLARVGRVSIRGRGKPGVLRSKRGANPGRQRVAFFGVSRNPVVGPVDPAQSRAHYLRARVSFDRSRKVQISTDGSFVGARLGPLVADQADALGGRESSLHLRYQCRILAGRIGAAIVALAAGIGEEEAARRRLQCSVVGC